MNKTRVTTKRMTFPDGKTYDTKRVLTRKIARNLARKETGSNRFGLVFRQIWNRED